MLQKAEDRLLCGFSEMRQLPVAHQSSYSNCSNANLWSYLVWLSCVPRCSLTEWRLRMHLVSLVCFPTDLGASSAMRNRAIFMLYQWVSKLTWLEALSQDLHSEVQFLFLLGRCQHHLGSERIHPVPQALSVTCCFSFSFFFFLHICSSFSLSFLSTPQSLPHLHIQHSACLLVSSCLTCNELYSSCISRKTKIAF